MYVSYKSIDLDEHRKEYGSLSKTPFQHQIEAFTQLSKVFVPGSEKGGSGILVLPTGAGKTFTSVNWLSKNIIPKYIKILWLAPSFYLLAQAFQTFFENAGEILPPRKILNIRCVSSNPSHASASSILLSDDVVIMTVQTAIKNLHLNALDRSGNRVETAFRKFIDSCKETGLFVVVDEAHHSPAYGCRKLLIGEEESALGLKNLVPNLHLLGLTATPTYTDKSKRGWLWKIFEDEIIYEVDKTNLQAQNILARPNYIEVPTGKEIQVDDKLYDRLAKEHQDIPEYIIEQIANDSKRNDFIVEVYLKDKSVYGQTIIFADRWFQCVYIKEKLLRKGIRADAIYSHIDAYPGSSEAINKKTQTENQIILEDFKKGKIDVLINVRMLTQGVDVPSVQTVFITRQTTSSILMTQMIGRALRGEKAGGSKEANIVLFFDDWKRLIDNWANPEDGGTAIEKPPERGTTPLEYISIRLIEELSRSINGDGSVPIPEFSKIFPTGWYITEIIYAVNESESTEEFTEFVMVYEHTEAKFVRFINSIVGKLSDEWSKEYLDDEWMQPQVDQWLEEYFDYKNDDIGQRLRSDLIKIVRHIAQKQSPPPYHPFQEREIYDLEKLADKIIDDSSRIQRQYLTKEFNKSDLLWKTFYKDFKRFEEAVDATIRKILDGDNQPDPPKPPPKPPKPIRLTDEEIAFVKARDGHKCLCCGLSYGNTRTKKKLRLEIDHIKPLSMGGETSIENSQTLCNFCNRFKAQDEISFLCNITQLSAPKELKTPNLELPFSHKDQYIVFLLTRIVNFFYRCKAVNSIKLNPSLIWEIGLYPGNNPEWLLKEKVTIIEFIQNNLGYNVQDITVVLSPDILKKGVEVKKTSGNDRNFTVHP